MSSKTMFTPPPKDDPYEQSMNTSVPFLTNTIFDPDTGEVMTNIQLIQNDETPTGWVSGQQACIYWSGDRFKSQLVLIPELVEL